MTKKEYVKIARQQYANPSNDDIEIDDDPDISVSDDGDVEVGAWVHAWVWVSNEEDETGSRWN